ncbi:MAG TPA: TCR/Tet family MFS transporter [Polyangiaceae bacterium]|nr:TCR/Tet family MFS transporter [Polyangiaceae bacterium]
MSSAPGRAAFVFIFITVCLDMLALGVIVPVLPSLVVELEHGDFARAASMTGVFGFAWAAMQFVFSPVQGVLSDRYGRRPVVLLSNFGLGVDYIVMALAPSLSWLFVGRLVSGITSASFSTATAYIADCTPPEKRAARFGMLGAAFGLGFILGPAIGGFLGHVSLRLPFWAAGALSLLNAAYGLFVLPESLPKEKRSKVSFSKANPFGSIELLYKTPGLLVLTAASFLYFLAHESLPSVFVLYTQYRYHWGERTIGVALAIVGLTSAAVAAVLVGRTVARIGERGALVVGLVSGGAAFALFGLAPTTLLFMMAIPVDALFGLVGPSMQALMSARIGADAQGQLQGALASMRGVTGMIGPILFTQIFARSIDGRIQVPGAPFLLASAFVLGSFLIVVAAKQRSDKVPA